MKKKEFQNLPSTDTPITADNLNEMQDNIEESCVIVSPTEPTTNEKVWIQKGKNLFNPNTNIEAKGFCRLADAGVLQQNTSFCSVKVKVKPNTIYVTSSDMPYTEWSNLCYFDKNMNFLSGDIYAGENKVFTTPENCYYITIALLNTFNWFQIEQGTAATEYEAYVEKAIHVKNDNGVYGEFYKEKEIATVNISLETGSGSANFPGGFTVENCVIVGHMDRNMYNIPFGNMPEVNVMLNGDNNNIQATGVGNFSGGASKTQIVLMRLY